MSVASSGELRLAVDYLREMFADSATWRAVVESPLLAWADTLTLINAGTSSESNARAAIKTGSWQNETDHADYKAPPVITIKHESFRSDRRATTGFDLDGRFEVMIVLPVPTTYQDAKNRFTEDGYHDFYNKVGRIMSEVRDLQRQNGYLDIQGIELVDHGFSHPKDDIANAFIGVMAVDWAGST